MAIINTELCQHYVSQSKFFDPARFNMNCIYVRSYFNKILIMQYDDSESVFNTLSV